LGEARARDACLAQAVQQGARRTDAPLYKWFEDGQLNVSYNCPMQPENGNANKIAIIFEADDGAVTQVTYQDLYHRYAVSPSH
jgi:hypothetical protein